MKSALLSALLLTLFIGFASCEDVIEVNVPVDEPRLVVDALIRVDTTKEFATVKVKISKTSPFFEPIQPVSDIKSIFFYYGIENEYGEVINGAYSNLAELEPGSGLYEPDPTFTTDQRIHTNLLEIGMTFWMFVEYEDRIYAAKTKYVPSVKIDGLVQGTGTLFDENDTEAILSFTDQPEVENYYVFDFDFGNFLTSEDTYYTNQAFSFSYFYEEALEPGDEITVSILGADEKFYRYMNLLLEQTEGGFGIFETPAATVRGNIFDVTGIDNLNQFDNVEQPDNFPLGYFSFFLEFTKTLVIQ